MLQQTNNGPSIMQAQQLVIEQNNDNTWDSLCL